MEPCSLGNILQDALCRKTTYSRKAEINDLNIFLLMNKVCCYGELK